MIKFFKQKHVDVIEKTSTDEYPAIVQEIHNEFETAGEKLLQEAVSFITEAEKTDRQKGVLLKSLGFGNTKEAKQAAAIEDAENNHKRIMNLVAHYRLSYPNNKFITDEMVNKICEKYDLLFGEVSLYTGFVPAVKLKKIADFKIQDRDVAKYELRDRNKNLVCYLEDGFLDESDNWAMNQLSSGEGLWYIGSDEGVVVHRRMVKDFGHKDKLFSKVHLANNNLRICAPAKDMDTTDKQVVNRRIVNRDIPDPVVLHPVKGGYLIVCAWGGEASDPLVVNESQN